MSSSDCSATLQRRRSCRDPAWTEESGRRILREPNRGDPVASEVFFVLHRHRFGPFVRAVLDEAADEPRPRLLDNRGQILELRGTLAGYRGQLPRATIWILRIAGVALRVMAPCYCQ